MLKLSSTSVTTETTHVNRSSQPHCVSNMGMDNTVSKVDTCTLGITMDKQIRSEKNQNGKQRIKIWMKIIKDLSQSSNGTLNLDNEHFVRTNTAWIRLGYVREEKSSHRRHFFFSEVIRWIVNSLIKQLWNISKETLNRGCRTRLYLCLSVFESSGIVQPAQ